MQWTRAIGLPTLPTCAVSIAEMAVTEPQQLPERRTANSALELLTAIARPRALVFYVQRSIHPNRTMPSNMVY